MHASGPDQRHVAHHRAVRFRSGRLRRRGRLAALVSMALGLLVVPAPTAQASGLVLTPSRELRTELTTFSVDGFATTGVLLDVLFNGVQVGTTGADIDTSRYRGTFKVPPPGAPGAAVCGANQVRITQIRTGALVDSGTITALCPSITVTPRLTAALPGQPRSTTYHITPKDFPFPDVSRYQLSVDGVGRAAAGTSTDVTFDAALACGTHQVTLAELVGETLIQPTANVFVMCSSITVTPNTLTRADEPATVSVRGLNFHPRAQVAVRIDGGTPHTVTTNTDGVFQAGLPVNGVACGTHQVSAVEGARLTTAADVSFSASAPLTVTDCSTAASLALDPVVIQVGMLTHVTGSAFTPATPVTLGWALPDGTALPGDCTVAADSGGAVDTYCLVLPHGITGARQLVATQGATTVTVDAVVDGGTMQPNSSDHELLFRR